MNPTYSDQALLDQCERIITQHMSAMKLEVIRTLSDLQSIPDSQAAEWMEEFRQLVNDHETDLLGDSVWGWKRDLPEPHEWLADKIAHDREIQAAE